MGSGQRATTGGDDGGGEDEGEDEGEHGHGHEHERTNNPSPTAPARAISREMGLDGIAMGTNMEIGGRASTGRGNEQLLLECCERMTLPYRFLFFLLCGSFASRMPQMDEERTERAGQDGK